MGMDVNYSPGMKKLFSMLERNRVDIIVIPYLSGLTYIKEKSLVGVKPFETVTFYG